MANNHCGSIGASWTHVLVRLSEERLLYQDLAALAAQNLIEWKTHTDVRYLSARKQVRRISVTMAANLTSWDSFLDAAADYPVENPTLWAALIRAVDVQDPTHKVEEWALACTAPFLSAWAGYRLWRQRPCIENQGSRKLKQGWLLDKAPWSWSSHAAIAARIAFTLIDFNIAQVAKTSRRRQLTDRGIRRLRRELAAQYGPAPLIVFTHKAYALFYIEEIMHAIGLPPLFSLRRGPPYPYPLLS